ncbi:hypothetical protein ABIB73_007067 [Bradyrhizobium sp. F1.4.3]|uniref:twin-arginine translocation signal domain-containing protein n=1 Tax=Bradyrhizobium sp. F1.4.3 TaxID=3156356 RepID=UPI00339AFAD8
MERRNFLRLAIGAAAGAAAFTAAAQAAPLSPQPIDGVPGVNADIRPAVASSEEIAAMKPEQVRWHRGWHHRHWGWHHRHWHRRHWRRW